MVATQDKVEKVSLLDRATVVTSDRSFSSIADASDFLNTRKVQNRVYRGDQLSVKFDGGKSYLGIKGDQRSAWFAIRDSGMEGLLQKSGFGMGNFPMDVCDDHLVEYNLNYLFKNVCPSREFTVILDKNPGDERSAIKAVMSDVYHHIPHQNVLNIISQLGIETKVHTLSLTKDFFRVSVTNPLNVSEPKVGDVSSVGVDFVNSENGRSALAMGQFIYRLWCSNGASRVDESASIRSKAIHRGGMIGRIFQEFSQGARYYLINGAKELENNFKILMDKPVSETFLRKAVDKIETVVGKKNSENMVDEWQKSIGATPCAPKEWEDRKIEKYADNRYDFAQLVTRSAHRDFTGIKRLGLEKVGGWVYGTANTLN